MMRLHAYLGVPGGGCIPSPEERYSIREYVHTYVYIYIHMYVSIYNMISVH